MTPAAWRHGLALQAVLLLVVLGLAAPALTPLAAVERWAFPAGAALLAGGLAIRGRPAAYVSLCLWLFMLTPFVRRLADDRLGYSHSNVLMLAPYLAASWSILRVPRFFLAPGGRAQWPMAVIFAAILYGFLLGLWHGRWFAAFLDLLRWSAPPLLACYVLTACERWRELRSALTTLALIALPLLSLYGLFQFVAPPRWDARWMLGSGMSSIGVPLPYQIRVFGTLNSPASLAYYLSALILITTAARTPLRWLNICLGLAALAVTLARSAWLALAAGMVLLAARAPGRIRLSLAAGAVALVALGPAVAVNPRIEKVVSDRIETLSDLAGDVSYGARRDAYSEFRRELLAHPLGQGFGLANVASSYTTTSRVIDGGPIEILLSLGLVAGAAYFAMLAVLLIVALFRPVFGPDNDFAAALAAVAVAQALALSSVTTVVGETGVLFWICLGMILAAPAPSPSFLQFQVGNIRQSSSYT